MNIPKMPKAPQSKKQIEASHIPNVNGRTISFETYRELNEYDKNSMTLKEPSCLNGNVRIVKYKVTVEPIIESNEVYAERLTKMWKECDNHHHWAPLEKCAERFGVKLNPEDMSSLRKR